MINITDIKVRILGDLDKLKKDLQKLFKEKFKIGVKGEGGDGNGDGKKQTGVLGLIFKRLLPIGMLLNLKPIADTIKILTGFAALGVLKIIDFIKWVKGFFPGAIEKKSLEAIQKKVREEMERIATDVPKILDQFREQDLRELVELQKLLKSVGIDVDQGLIQSASVIRGALEAQGIDTKAFSDEWLLKLGDGFTENVAALDIISGNISNLDKAIGGVNTLIDTLVNEKIKELADDIAKTGGKTASDINKELDTISTAEIKVLDDNQLILEQKLDALKIVLDLLPTGIGDVITSFLDRIIGFIKGLFPGGDDDDEKQPPPPTETANDFVVTKGGRVIKSNPEDTIIATRNPEGIGGGNKTFIFNGVTPQQMIDVIKRELGVDVLRSSRF